MNILFLSTENPYPPDHGHHIRTYYVLKRIAKDHTVFFVGFAKSRDELRYKKHLEELCKSVDIFIIPDRNDYFSIFIKLLLNLFSTKPYTVKRFFRKEAQNRILQILADQNVDLVHFDMLHLGMYYGTVHALPKLLVNHNVESLRLARLISVQKNYFIKLLLYIQYLKLRSFERSMCPQFEKCIVVSDTDKEILLRLCGKNNFKIVPNGVDTEYFKPSMTRGANNDLVWTGGMAGLYNKDAVDFFIKDVLPEIQVEIPAVTVTFVGRSPTEKLRKLAAENRNIHIRGYVEDVRPFVEKSSIFIAPMRSGSGTKIKVLNAMAQGKAVITTTIGAEGIVVEHNKNIIIADDPKEFAGQVVRLLKNPSAAEKIGLAGRKVIEQYYSWEVVFDQMMRIYENLHKRSATA